MNSRIGGPKARSSAATTKNRRPRAITAVTMKVPSGMAVQPDMIVMTLNGKGVTPAVSTAQNPTPLKRSLNAAIASALPSAARMGCPIESKANIPMA